MAAIMVQGLGNGGIKTVDLEVIPEMLDGGREYRLEARLVIPPGAIPKGGFSGEVVVETDHPERREATYRFFGFFPER